MTLGKKLSGYRKIAGLTQQQLGDYLNLSAQAISKWEKDMTEPDLSTLRSLAELYKVSVDELIDLNSGFPGNRDEEEVAQDVSRDTAAQIGFCKDCGIVVTDENLGQKDPVILCAKCVNARAEAKKREKLAAEKKIEAEKRAERARIEANRDDVKKLIKKSTFWATAATIVFLIGSISALAKGFNGSLLAGTIISPYLVFSLVFCLFFDTVVSDIVVTWTTKSFSAPGLIFTFDLDGFIWLIGMKILFWFIGLIFGIAVALIGIALGLLIAPFSFPFTVAKLRRALANGEPVSEVEA